VILVDVADDVVDRDPLLAGALFMLRGEVVSPQRPVSSRLTIVLKAATTSAEVKVRIPQELILFASRAVGSGRLGGVWREPAWKVADCSDQRQPRRNCRLVSGTAGISQSRRLARTIPSWRRPTTRN